jgi:hypothetical protein
MLTDRHEEANSRFSQFYKKTEMPFLAEIRASFLELLHADGKTDVNI